MANRPVMLPLSTPELFDRPFTGALASIPGYDHPAPLAADDDIDEDDDDDLDEDDDLDDEDAGDEEEVSDEASDEDDVDDDFDDDLDEDEDEEDDDLTAQKHAPTRVH
jgi:hypothetical protein